MNSILRLAALSAALGVSTLAAPARATSIADCGNIDLTANAQCTAEVSGGCTTKCSQLSFDAACDAKLNLSCQGTCNATADVSCTGTCQTDCEAACTVNPGSFDCSGSCKADCNASCTGSCASAADKTQCQGQCNATCSGQCDAKCTGTPPTADCTAKCQSKCSGQCTAEANMTCQINCQSSGYAQCKADLQGGCNTQCSDPNGALFCNGNYIDTNGNAASCVAALEALFPTITVTGSAYANCSSNNTCSAHAEGSASCAMSERPTESSGSALALAGFAGLTVLARRRRRT